MPQLGISVVSIFRERAQPSCVYILPSPPGIRTSQNHRSGGRKGFLEASSLISHLSIGLLPVLGSRQPRLRVPGDSNGTAALVTCSVLHYLPGEYVSPHAQNEYPTPQFVAVAHLQRSKQRKQIWSPSCPYVFTCK